MEASELRINNWVAFKHKTKDGFEYTTITRSCYEGRIIENSYDPIPLTEDWLLKFGFRKGHNEYGNTFHIMDTNGYTAKFTVEHWSDESIQDEYKGLFWCDRVINKDANKYVHQLQNLYFALTGEELIIKP